MTKAERWEQSIRDFIAESPECKDTRDMLERFEQEFGRACTGDAIEQFGRRALAQFIENAMRSRE